MPDETDSRETALRDSEERLRAIVETAAEGIVTIDECGAVESVNTAAERMFGYSRAEIVGREASMLMPSFDREDRTQIAGAGGEVTGRRKDGSIFPMHLSISEVTLADRRIFTGIIRDISESKFAQAQLFEFAERLAKKRKAIEDQVQLLDISHDAIFVWQEPGGVVYWNRGATELYGYNAEEAIGKIPSELLSTHFPIPRSDVLAHLREKGLWHGELRHRTKDGRESIVSARFQTVPDAGGALRVMESANDITAQRRLERELLGAIAREQRRIGQDLHDDLCQQLAGIQLMTGVVADELSAVSPRQAARVSRIAEQIRLTIDRAKMLAHGLSPVALEAGGLGAGLEELAETSAELFGVRCEFGGECEGDLAQVDIDMGTHLYRIAQEAITNSIKHGNAKCILVNVDSSAEQWVLTVSDDGCGISDQGFDGKGMGLRTMKYRASTIGGSLALHSSPGQGSIVSCRFPPPAKS
jgi:PAS domain S-box-containing protein